jgi:competence protein CoiA
MQLYAHDEDGQVISASQAQKQRNYRCLECQGNVRIRAGFHRQHHFYHLQLTPGCRQSQKSLEHLQTQIRLQRIIGQHACHLEYRFSQIHRIADVAWPAEKLVFEVQCSPISAKEVAERIKDYRQVGFEVVWILHEQTFGQRRMTAAEMRLRNHPCYFCNLNADGEGLIYDHFDLIQRGLRTHKLDLLSVDLSRPKIWSSEKKLSLKRAEGRLTESPLYFAGDLIDLALSKDQSSYINQAREIEQAYILKPTTWPKRCWGYFKRLYRIIFQLLLEKISH